MCPDRTYIRNPAIWLTNWHGCLRCVEGCLRLEYRGADSAAGSVCKSFQGRLKGHPFQGCRNADIRQCRLQKKVEYYAVLATWDAGSVFSVASKAGAFEFTPFRFADTLIYFRKVSSWRNEWLSSGLDSIILVFNLKLYETNWLGFAW